MRIRSGGFTLFELMIALAVMSILVALAVPSFREYGQNSRIVAFHNDFITALNYARNEAIRRATPVAVCASANLTTCSATSDSFQNGWIVFTDATGAVGTLDGTDERLQIWEAPDMNGLSFTSAGTGRRFVQFTPTGLANPVSTNKTYDLRPANCPSGQLRQRSINVNGIGAIRAERVAC